MGLVMLNYFLINKTYCHLKHTSIFDVNIQRRLFIIRIDSINYLYYIE